MPQTLTCERYFPTTYVYIKVIKIAKFPYKSFGQIILVLTIIAHIMFKSSL